MYAVIETGGKQYRVQEGQVLRVEKVDAGVEEIVEFDRVLAVSDGDTLIIGQPLVANAKVQARVVEQGKGKKIIVFKFKPKKNYSRKQGHRQPYTAIAIEKIIY